ncbi:nicotinamide-nucleotide adenylyltransferase [Cavenderia fasciculata]|uniref:Nicotinamide-nucleotide adenylyltransferase n=1 Tax=Cavenderia fasciculata TaxID=261658 RepID=F4PQA6_CACFS|nr:nicotinamide-nucleotide adenylyltransferase [Cavenderia fasciculata]EGG22569.1 nicotinamide-nucleotide adenylyltransferase [Cavenderia fasciculata]|eukprot:XP_004360420.1 nicotinamide-nucleotide adenylyltransferase [Cavenderia fasciculata]
MTQDYIFPIDKLDQEWMTDTKNKDIQPVVLLACGSFNPITFMHLRMFEICKDWCNNHTGDNGKKYHVIGGYMSPVGDAYKKATLIAAHYRLQIVNLAVMSSEWVMMDKWESMNLDFTPTRQVLDHFHLYVNNHFKQIMDPASYRPVQIKLICGADLLASFNVPNLWDEEDMKIITSDKYGIICIERPGTNFQEILDANPILQANKNNIYHVPVGITNDLSSTKIRDMISKGLSINYLTEAPVIDYIHKNNLYGYQKK